MKKYNVVLALIAILLGVSSCKKEELVVQTTKDYPITLWSNNDSKASIKPTQNGYQAVVNHELGDHIYLAYKGYCNNSNVRVSGIINNNFKFDGKLYVNNKQSEIPGDSPLFFYFLGGVYLKDEKNNVDEMAFFTEYSLNPSGNYYSDTTAVCVSLQNSKDQNKGKNKAIHSPVLCFGRSNKDFSADDKEYHTTFQNKCSLVKYSLKGNKNGETIPYDARVYIQGLNNVVKVDFKVAYNKCRDKDYTPPQGYDDDGFKFLKRKGRIQEGCSPTGNPMTITNIIIPNRDENNNECYSILLPQENVGKGKGNELFGYYFKKDEKGNYIKDENGKCVPTYLKVDFPYDNVETNKYYKCTIKVDEDQHAASHPKILDYPYDA